MSTVTIDETRGALEWPGRCIRLARSHTQIMRALLGRPRSYEQLIQVLWGHDANGGPDDPHNLLKVQVSKLRYILAEAGCPVTIVTNRGHGFEIGPFTTEATPTEEKHPMGFIDLQPPVEGTDSKVRFSPYKQGKTRIAIGAVLMQAAGLTKGSKVRIQVDMTAKPRTVRIFGDERGPFVVKGTRGGIGMVLISNGTFPALADKTPAEGVNNGSYVDIFLPEAWQAQAPAAAPAPPPVKAAAPAPAPAMANGRPTANHPWRSGDKRAA